MKSFKNPYEKKLYSVWSGMRRRCKDPKHIQFKDYGGRGISVCCEWDAQGGFRAFYCWALNNGFGMGLTIDRIDTNGNYEPSNCRWSTMAVQERNRRVRKTNKIGIPGVTARVGKKRISYRVTICADGKIFSVGTFGSLMQATNARIQAETKYWGFSSTHLLICRGAA